MAAILTQEVIETVLIPSAQKARTTQLAIEVVVRPVLNARMTQEVIEAIMLPNTQKARTTQLAIEVVVRQQLLSAKKYGKTKYNRFKKG